ncbi:MAG TPA: hypothetical protein VGI97_03595 [Gemmatimonadaceae bacterium]|jgi:hypothetical protein
MSRAFTKEDHEAPKPRRTWSLPPRDDPGFDEAAASALLEGARVSEVLEAEEATGFAWGEPRLRPYVERALERARAAGDDRLEQVAARFLRHGR